MSAYMIYREPRMFTLSFHAHKQILFESQLWWNKSVLLAELHSIMSRGCRYLLFLHHNYQVSLNLQQILWTYPNSLNLWNMWNMDCGVFHNRGNLAMNDLVNRENWFNTWQQHLLLSMYTQYRNRFNWPWILKFNIRV